MQHENARHAGIVKKNAKVQSAIVIKEKWRMHKTRGDVLREARYSLATHTIDSELDTHTIT